MRIGIGYDVHKLGINMKLILGGVFIPFEKGLIGHSDADVLVHSIMDALIGAMAKGDIGKLFPDTDNSYKDISSMILLQKVNEMLIFENYNIINIDCVIVAQKPKLLPYIDTMLENISTVLCIDRSCLNIKATTEEGLGFTGDGTGISAKSVCLIEKNIK